MMDERELLRRAKQDKKALEELVKRYARKKLLKLLEENEAS